MTNTPAPVALGTDQARTRLHELTVIDVRTPAEYASGHLPGALSIPLDHVRRVLPEIRHAAERGDVLVVCASGAWAAEVFSALTNTCGMAVVLGKLPHNRPRAADLDATLAALRSR